MAHAGSCEGQAVVADLLATFAAPEGPSLHADPAVGPAVHAVTDAAGPAVHAV